jgi:hypothetical protein
MTYFLIPYSYTQSVRLLGRGISSPQGLYLNIRYHRQNKHTQTSAPRVEFEPTISAFGRVKTNHASDRAATAIGNKISYIELKLTTKNLDCTFEEYMSSGANNLALAVFGDPINHPQ